MSITKVKGLVLSFSNINDNDRIFTLFCPEVGKITAMSKGVRSHKHKDFSALQPFSLANFVLDDSKGIAYINQTELLESFYDIRQSVEKMSLGTYVLDILSYLADEFTYDDEFFSFTLNTLYVISKLDISSYDDLVTNLFKLKLIFELKTLCQAGYMPSMDFCINCKSKTDLLYFNTYYGSTMCESCSKGLDESYIVKISDSIYKMIKYIISSTYREVFKFNASKENILYTSSLIENYFINKFEFESSKLLYFKSIIDKDYYK